jgi:uncharacterized SAM-binding protein YcdF (DUF218 family)
LDLPLGLLIAKYVGVILLPPTNALLLTLVGAWRAWRGHRGALTAICLWGGLGASIAFCMLPVGNALLNTVEREPVLDAQRARAARAQAIVILTGGKNKGAIEYGGETTNRYSAQRARYGARVARELKLPILVAGGKPTGGRETEAALMARSLAEDYNMPVQWMEDRSLTTQENARYVKEMLLPLGIKRIVLVSDAVHMLRARPMFEHAGFEVIAAPTGFENRRTSTPIEWLPSAEGMRRSYLACHEWLGLLYFLLQQAMQ